MLAPKGTLIIIGGNEDKGNGVEHISYARINTQFQDLEILRTFLLKTNKPNPRIEVITSASLIPDEVAQAYSEAFSRLGLEDIGIMDIRSREDARNPAFLKRLKKADGILFSGGNQLRLSMIFGGSDFLKIIRDRYQNEDFTIAGTSAGAMAMSATMIIQGDNDEALIKGGVKMSSGLALLKDVIVDTHFVARGRFGRLSEAVASNPGCLGIGLGDDTALIIHEGHRMEAIGSGLVIILDGQHIGHSNIADVGFGNALSIENLVMHVMAKGNFYDLRSKRFSVSIPEEPALVMRKLA